MADMTGEQLARYAWGVFIGGVIGFVVGKVYLIWAILFMSEGLSLDERYARGLSYELASPPLFVSAPAHSVSFMTTMVIVFAGLGLLFVLTFVPLRRRAPQPVGDTSVQDLH